MEYDLDTLKKLYEGIHNKNKQIKKLVRDVRAMKQQLKKGLRMSGISIEELKSTPKSTMHSKLPKVKIYTDGSCEPRSKIGSYTAILIYKKTKEKIITKAIPDTNSRVMELYAIKYAIEQLTTPCYIELYTDYLDIVNIVTKNEWKKQHNKWVSDTVNLDKLQNKTIISDILDLCFNSGHNIKFVWVKGHNGDAYNEACDKICKNTIEEYKQRQREVAKQHNTALNTWKDYQGHKQ